MFGGLMGMLGTQRPMGSGMGGSSSTGAVKLKDGGMDVMGTFDSINQGMNNYMKNPTGGGFGGRMTMGIKPFGGM